MGVIKPKGLVNYSINAFDLYGYEETGLSKAFAYTISKNQDLLFRFLRFVGIKISKSKYNFSEIEISIEKFREEGRTDIEIKMENNFHLIVECKVGNNKVEKQREQYLSAFNENCDKFLCFITQTNDYKKQFEKNIIIKNIGWYDIDNLIDEKTLLNDSLIKDFQKYLRKGYYMRDQKEILVQDLAYNNEIKRYRDFHVYRRNVISGSPLYFSPYFTKKSQRVEGEGLSYLSKILGIISFKPAEIDFLVDDIKQFAPEDDIHNLAEKWISGVKMDNDDIERTYFFLDYPVKLMKPLLKADIKSGDTGKEWIALKIPSNRCVTFEEFIRRMNQG
jgi:hypothetical protein